jgi:hypothetical protein
MQSYTLDRATRVLEICDFAAGQEQACRHRSCAFGPRDAELAPPPAARAGNIDQLPCLNMPVGERPCALP